MAIDEPAVALYTDIVNALAPRSYVAQTCSGRHCAHTWECWTDIRDLPYGRPMWPNPPVFTTGPRDVSCE